MSELITVTKDTPKVTKSVYMLADKTYLSMDENEQAYCLNAITTCITHPLFRLQPDKNACQLRIYHDNDGKLCCYIGARRGILSTPKEPTFVSPSSETDEILLALLNLVPNCSNIVIERIGFQLEVRAIIGGPSDSEVSIVGIGTYGLCENWISRNFLEADTSPLEHKLTKLLLIKRPCGVFPLMQAMCNYVSYDERKTKNIFREEMYNSSLKQLPVEQTLMMLNRLEEYDAMSQAYLDHVKLDVKSVCVYGPKTMEDDTEVEAEFGVLFF